MKFARKMTAVLLAAALCLLLSMAVFAAEDTALWLKVDQTAGTTVQIVANTTVTDGVLTLNYDSSVLTYQGITAAEGYVAAHAVNDGTAGVLRISWVAPGAYSAEGEHVLFTLQFAGVEQANTLALAGVAQDAEGNALTLGQTQVTRPPETEPTQTQAPTEATEETGGDSADTGDRSHLLSAACVGLLAACGVAMVVKKGRAAK